MGRLTDPIMKKVIPTIPAAVGAGVLGELTGSALTHILGKSVQQEAKTLPHVSPQAVNRAFEFVKKKHGLDVGYMHDPYLTGLNAGYSPRKSLLDRAKQTEKVIEGPFKEGIPPATRRALKRRIEKIRERMGRHGLVMTGTHFKKPGTVEHELGHAIAAHRGSFLERLGHGELPKYSLLYHTLPSYGAALAAGLKKGPLAGLAAGGLVGALTELPTLKAEWAANKYAEPIIKEVHPGRPLHGKWKAYGTYVLPSTLPYAISGLLMGLVGRKLKWR